MRETRARAAAELLQDVGKWTLGRDESLDTLGHELLARRVRDCFCALATAFAARKVALARATVRAKRLRRGHAAHELEHLSVALHPRRGALIRARKRGTKHNRRRAKRPRFHQITRSAHTAVRNER